MIYIYIFTAKCLFFLNYYILKTNKYYICNEFKVTIVE